MWADSAKRFKAPSSGGTTETLLATYTTSGSFVVPSGYSSFKIELIGGKDGDEDWTDWGFGIAYGSYGTKATFTVPLSDMPVGSTQTFTVGTNGANGYHGAGLGTDSIFKGMTAKGGGRGVTGTTYTNTTPNQTGYPPRMKIWGIS